MKTYIFSYDYQWVGNRQLKKPKTRIVVIKAKDIIMAIALAKSNNHIELNKHDLVTILEKNEVWVY